MPEYLMSNGNSADQAIWDWLKANPPVPGRQNSFTGQSVNPRHQVEAPYIDALWRFANAGIIRVDGDSQFTLTEAGKLAVAEDISPYQKSSFLDALDGAAPLLDSDSRAYVALVLDCVYSVPTAAVVLARVALEKELDSVIAICIDHWDPKGTTRQKLHARDISERFSELVNQLQSRGIQEPEDGRLFESHVNEVRITANRILHPQGGIPQVSPMMVQSILHALMGFGTLASQVKDRVQN